ncbi:MAG: MBL fold metallo-hydrolase [Bdellovibrionota bacterium]
MFEFCVLSSGSKANCLYVRKNDTRVLVDCGLSARETARRLRSIGVEPTQIHAIVVTHEHRDHICGIPVFHRLHKTKIYANHGTYQGCDLLNEVHNDFRHTFETGESFRIGELDFESFSIVHDAADPVAFRISDGEHTLGIVTDLGQITSLVRERVKDLDAIVLESNHDPLLLQECPYPWELKQRIAGRSGHLSNDTAGDLLKHIHQESGRALRYVVAAHISEKSNDPGLALEVLRNAWAEHTLRPHPEFAAADPYSPTRVYRFFDDPASLSD